MESREFSFKSALSSSARPILCGFCV